MRSEPLSSWSHPPWEEKLADPVFFLKGHVCHLVLPFCLIKKKKKNWQKKLIKVIIIIPLENVRILIDGDQI